MANRRTQDHEYDSYLTLDECQEVMKQYLINELSADDNFFEFSADSKGKEKIIYKRNGERKKASYHINPCIPNPNHCAPMLRAYHAGESRSASLKKMLDVVGGFWKEESIARWQANRNPNQSKPRLSAEELAEQNRLASEKIEANRLKALKEEYLARLIGTAVCQYVELSAKANQDARFHEHQKVKTPNKIPYIIKKNISITEKDGLYIMSPIAPTKEKLRGFIYSNKFELPVNDIGIGVKELDEALIAKTDFSALNHLYENDFRDGSGFVVSHDANGTTLSLQRFMPYTSMKSGKDKYNASTTLTNGGMFVFDRENKIKNPDYKPHHIFLTEGWASGKVLDDLTHGDKGNMVAVGWTANQLLTVATSLLNKYPDAHLTIAADNDIKSFINSLDAVTKNNDLNRVRMIKNTGLEEAINIYSTLEDQQERISIITPKIPLTIDISKGNVSDYDDIRLKYGMDMAAKVLNQHLVEAAQRKHDGVNEASYYINMYNTQAKYFAEKHILPIHGIGNKRGDIVFDPHPECALDFRLKKLEEARNDPSQPIKEAIIIGEDEFVQQYHEITAAFKNTNEKQASTNVVKNPAKQAVEQVASAPVKELAMTGSDTSPAPTEFIPLGDLMNMGSRIDTESEFDKKTKQFLNAISADHPKSSNEVTPVELNIEDNIEPVPLINPAIMTTLLYQEYVQNTVYALIDGAMDRDDILEKLNNAEKLPAMNKIDRMMGAILDPIMGEHVPNEIEKVLDIYKNTPIYQDLAEIKEIISDHHISISAESQEGIKEIQSFIASEIISSNIDLGLDDDLSNRIVQSNIIHQDTPTKQVFFREFRNCLRTLDGEDEKWVSRLKDTLQENHLLSSAVINPTMIKSESPQP